MIPDGAVMMSSGVLRLLIAACVLMRQVLLEPTRANYPNARARLRYALMGLSLFLVYNGTELIWRANTHPPHGPLWSGFWLSVAWLTVEALSLEKTLRSWLPARIQRRVQQLLHIASCKNRRVMQRERDTQIAAMWPSAPRQAVAPASVVAPALAELALGGAHVTAPEEGPAISFTDALRDAFPAPAPDDSIIPPALRDL